MGGGGGTTYSQGTTYTSDMPAWIEPAHMELARWATEAARARPFPSYQDAQGNAIPRIAGFDPMQEAAFLAREEMYNRGDPESAAAWNAYSNANAALTGINPYTGTLTQSSTYSPGTISSSYSTPNVLTGVQLSTDGETYTPTLPNGYTSGAMGLSSYTPPATGYAGDIGTTWEDKYTNIGLGTDGLALDFGAAGTAYARPPGLEGVSGAYAPAAASGAYAKPTSAADPTDATFGYVAPRGAWEAAGLVPGGSEVKARFQPGTPGGAYAPAFTPNTEVYNSSAAAADFTYTDPTGAFDPTDKISGNYTSPGSAYGYGTDKVAPGYAQLTSDEAGAPLRYSPGAVNPAFTKAETQTYGAAAYADTKARTWQEIQENLMTLDAGYQGPLKDDASVFDFGKAPGGYTGPQNPSAIPSLQDYAYSPITGALSTLQMNFGDAAADYTTDAGRETEGFGTASGGFTTPSELMYDKLGSRADPNAPSNFLGEAYAANTYNPGSWDASLGDESSIKKSYVDPQTDRLEARITEMQAELEAQFAKEDMAKNAAGVASGSRGGYREAIYEAERNAELEAAKVSLRNSETERAWATASEQFERDRRSGLLAAQFDDESEFRQSQQGIQAFESDREADFREWEARNRLGSTAGEQTLRASIANQDARGREATLYEQLGMSASDQSLRASVANQSARQAESELWNRFQNMSAEGELRAGLAQEGNLITKAQQYQGNMQAAGDQGIRSAMANQQAAQAQAEMFNRYTLSGEEQASREALAQQDAQLRTVELFNRSGENASEGLLRASIANQESVGREAAVTAQYGLAASEQKLRADLSKEAQTQQAWDNYEQQGLSLSDQGVRAGIANLGAGQQSWDSFEQMKAAAGEQGLRSTTATNASKQQAWNDWEQFKQRSGEMELQASIANQGAGQRAWDAAEQMQATAGDQKLRGSMSQEAAKQQAWNDYEQLAIRSAEMGMQAGIANQASGQRSWDSFEQMKAASGDQGLRTNLPFQAQRQQAWNDYEQLGLAGSEQGIRAGIANQQAAQAQAEMRNRYQMGMAQERLRAEMGDQQQGTAAGIQKNQTEVEMDRLEVEAKRANAAQKFQDTQLAQELIARESEFGLGQAVGDRQARMEDWNMRNQALSERGRQDIQASAALAPLTLEAQRLKDEAEYREAGFARDTYQQNLQNQFTQADTRLRQAGLASDLGTSYDQRSLNRIRELERAGTTKRELTQSVLDMSYGDYMRRTNWAQDQLNWLQGILSGAPAQQQQFNQSPAPSPVSQLLGLGLVGSQIGGLFNGES